jgi:hypothetical protein
MTTQVQRVRAHLEAGKTITPASAIAVYGIFRLSSVIEDLRATGMEIDCVLKHDEMGKQYGEYRQRKAIGPGSTVQVKRGHAVGLPNWVRTLRAAKVIASHADTALVRFIRGKNLQDIWMNHKELVNAD